MSSDTSSNELYEKTPFNTPLVESGYRATGDDIRALKSDPEKIVRVSETYSPDNLPTWLARHKKIIDKLKNEYGFAIADMDMVIGPGVYKDTQRVYIVTDRVHGPMLRDKQFSPGEIPAAKEELDKFFSAMIQYYWDVTRQGGDYNPDLAQHNTQFIWGRRKGESEDKIYLVDLGVSIEHHDLDPFSNSRVLNGLYDANFTSSYGYGVYADINFLERKHHIRLNGARQKLGELADYLLSKGNLPEYAVPKANTLKGFAESGLGLAR